MLAAVKGIVQGNIVIIKDDDIREYDGEEVIVTLLNYPRKKVQKEPVDWDSFSIPCSSLLKVCKDGSDIRQKRLLKK